MKKHIIFIDLDGTLLEHTNTPNQETVKYLKSLKEHAHVVINTGRPYRTSREFYELLELDTPISNYNGAYVHNPKNPEFKERLLTLDRNDYFKILRALDDKIEGSFAEIKDDVYGYKDITKYNAFLHSTQVYKGNIFEELKEDPNSVIIIAKPGATAEIMEFIKNETGFKARDWGGQYNYIIELYVDSVSKGSSCEYIVGEMGIEHHLTICFGDEQNDVSMFEYIHTSVAMGNAHDERIGNAPKYKTLKNTEGGIKHFLDDYFNERDLTKYKKR